MNSSVASVNDTWGCVWPARTTRWCNAFRKYFNVNGLRGERDEINEKTAAASCGYLSEDTLAKYRVSTLSEKHALERKYGVPSVAT